MRLLILFCLLSFTAKSQVIPQYKIGTYYTVTSVVIYNNGLYAARVSFTSGASAPTNTKYWSYKGELPVCPTVYVDRFINNDSLQKRIVVLEKQAASGLTIRANLIKIDTLKHIITW